MGILGNRCIKLKSLGADFLVFLQSGSTMFNNENSTQNVFCSENHPLGNPALDAVFHCALMFITGDAYRTHHCVLYQKVRLDLFECKEGAAFSCLYLQSMYGDNSCVYHH